MSSFVGFAAPFATAALAAFFTRFIAMVFGAMARASYERVTGENARASPARQKTFELLAHGASDRINVYANVVLRIMMVLAAVVYGHERIHIDWQWVGAEPTLCVDVAHIGLGSNGAHSTYIVVFFLKRQ